MLNILRETDIIGQVIEGGQFILPNGDVVSPAYAGWEQGDFSLAEAPVLPQPDPIPQSITFAQLLIGLVSEGWITEAEGEAWLAGVLPAQVTALIATLPVEQQFAAKARAARPSEVLRMDPFVISMGAAQGKTPEELDQFFRTYSGV